MAQCSSKTKERGATFQIANLAFPPEKKELKSQFGGLENIKNQVRFFFLNKKEKRNKKRNRTALSLLRQDNTCRSKTETQQCISMPSEHALPVRKMSLNNSNNTMRG